MGKGTQRPELLFITGLFPFILGSSDFHHIDLFKSYHEAKSYCRDTYADLATIHNSSEMKVLLDFASSGRRRAWIGLELGEERRWHWALPDRKPDFFNWRAGEPATAEQDACAAMDSNGKWFVSGCAVKWSFVCHGRGDSGVPIFVGETKSWRDAQNHCRDQSLDLVGVNSAEENEEVHEVSDGRQVWIGLFSDRWRWSDGDGSSFRYWKPKQPNAGDRACVVSVLRNQGMWNNLNCNTKFTFICQGQKKPSPTRNATTTDRFRTNRTTLAATLSTVVSHTGGFTTGRVGLTSTELHHATNATPAAVTAPGTGAGRSSAPPEIDSGKLILIQENMTWPEALGYCRERHGDLVHISSEGLQAKVAETARDATSSHVWLGLRYTCRFDFWSWTDSAAGCYRNWAAGHGPGRGYGCGVTGALQATGRQRWVGLPETERLNFICRSCAG